MRRVAGVWTSTMGLMLVWSAIAYAAISGTLKVQVNNASGPVAGARVMVDSSGDSSFSARALTAADGSFTVANTPAGTVHVKVYSSQGKVVGSGSGVLKQQGDVLSLTITVSP